MSRGPLRVAIVGCGAIGAVHADVITHRGGGDLTVSVLVNRSREPAATLARRIIESGGPAPLIVGTLDEALPHCDIVAICTPSGSHAELAVQALDAGKHTLIEKPVDIDPVRAATIVQAQRRAGTGVVAAVVSQHRYDRSSEAVWEAVSTGQLGRLTSAAATVAWWRSQGYYDSAGWRGSWALDGGGALMNQGIHTLDLLVWYLGQPISVSAQMRLLAHRDIEVEDTIAATVNFQSGAIGTLLATTAAYPGLTARLQIHGSRGSAIIDDDELIYLSTRSGAPLPTTDGAASARLTDALSRQYDDFLHCIADHVAPRVTVQSAAATLDLAAAIYRSARENRPVEVAPLVVSGG